MDVLIVSDVELHDVAAHLGGDADEVGPQRRIVGLGPRGELQHGDDDRDGRARDDEPAEQPAHDTPCARIRASCSMA